MPETNANKIKELYCIKTYKGDFGTFYAGKSDVAPGLRFQTCETKIIAMTKRNLKNINHWIKELRDIAIKANLFNYDEDTKEQTPMTKAEVFSIFTKRDYSEYFNNGDTPQEAFDLTMDEWRDAVNESCRV